MSFYYLYDGDGHLGCVLAEITNIPWGERHCYALGPFAPRRGVRPRRQQLDKQFHVSPFMPMDLGYDWSFGEPGEDLVVHMQNRDEGGRFFDATLSLRWRPMTRRALAAQLFRLPAQAWRVPLLIHAHAGLLRLKGNRFHAHPGKVAGGAP